MYQRPGQKVAKDRNYSVRTKRLMAGWDESFLLQVLFGAPAAPAAGAAPPHPG
jgi:hypothetical protein